MNEEQTSYKVTDRRLFNSDGSPREVPENERPEPTPAKPESVPAAASPATEPAAQEEAAAAPNVVEATLPEETAASADAGPASAESELEAAEVDLPGANDPTSFANFMMSIASNAASSLGMMEHPVTHKREVDLELGKHWIDVLGMLEQKTRGNLLPQEEQILEGLLADLRMQFVSLTNATPKARTFSSQDITGG
ncbi:MAG: DUF1844 domain-containing protein [Acidobacteriota bacterium]